MKLTEAEKQGFLYRNHINPDFPYEVVQKIGRKVGHKKHVFLQICDKTASKTKIFDSSR